MSTLFAPRFRPAGPSIATGVMAVIGSVVVVTAFAFVSAIAGARDYLYGGPIPIGSCHVDFMLLGMNSCESGPSAWITYIVDIALVAVVFGLIGGLGGPAAIVAATLLVLVAIRFAPRDQNGAVETVWSWLVNLFTAIAGGNVQRLGPLFRRLRAGPER